MDFGKFRCHRHDTFTMRLESCFFLVIFAYFLGQNVHAGHGKYFGDIHEIYSEENESELVHAEFLTKFTGGYQQAYHVLKLSFNVYSARSSRKERIIHLHLTHSSIDHTDTHSDEETGHYSGTISQDPEGSAAVSLDKDGLNGYLIYGGEHYALEPVSGGGNFTHLLHRMYRTTDVLKKENSTLRSDVLKVPKEEWAKAVAVMINSTDGEETSDEDEIINAGLDAEESDGSGGDDGEMTLETLAAKGKNKKKGAKAGKEKIMEVGFFVDNVMYQDWKTRHHKDFKKRLKKLVLNFMNNMNLLYAQPSLGMKLSFRLVFLEFLTSQPPNLPATTDGSAYLEKFCKFAGDKNTRGAKWDHAILMTGMNMQDILGIAWYGTFCMQHWSCSITEGTSLGASQTLAHELAHSLGVEHDGMADIPLAKDCADDKYVMSPSAGPGKVTWSECSAKQLKKFVAHGADAMGVKAATPKCLSKASTLKNQQIKFQRADGKLPGQIYDVNYQCKYHCGKGFSLSKNIPLESVCNWIECFDQSGEFCSAHPALEGTVCGAGKYCRIGKCVKIPKNKGKSKG